MRINMREMEIKAHRRARRVQRLDQGGKTVTRVMEGKKTREKYPKRAVNWDEDE